MPRALTAALMLVGLGAGAPGCSLSMAPPAPEVSSETYSLTMGVAEDTYVERGPGFGAPNANTNFGTEPEMLVGKDQGAFSLLRADDDAIRTAAASQTLLSAQLAVWVDLDASVMPCTSSYELHPMRRSWTELGATFLCPIDTNTTNAAMDCPPARARST